MLLVSEYDGIYPCNHERISIDLVLMYCITSVVSASIARSFHEKFSPIGSVYIYSPKLIISPTPFYIFPFMLFL